MRHISLLFSALVTAALLVSCAVSRPVSRAALARVTAGDSTGSWTHRLATPEGQPVRAYTTSDGRRHVFAGFARLSGDTLVLRRPASSRSSIERPRPELMERVALEDVESVECEHIDSGRTVAFAVVMTVVIGVWAAFAYVVASLGS